MEQRQIQRIKTISDYHRFNDMPQPEHPLISIVDYAKLKRFTNGNSVGMVFDFYTISLKRGVGKMFYGQQQYDFDEGVMYFMSPNQVLRVENNPNNTNQERLG